MTSRSCGSSPTRTARLNIERLVEMAILQPANGASYGKTFIAREILRISEGHET